jgi:UDP-N-acetylmuramate--alanine ligase
MKFNDPIHFIGIGGSGMSALAELAIKGGLKVTGSDNSETATIKKLVTLGIPISPLHAADNITGAKTVVFSTAIPQDNPELLAAKKQGLQVIHRADFLAALMEGKQAITVAGTHGKTTTSAMITYVLEQLGVDPIAAIGGRMRAVGSSARFGSGSLFVAEADESDGSFLKYDPYLAILTNIEADHMDFFSSQENLEETFLQYLNKLDEDGVAIIGWDNPTSRRIGQQFAGNRLTYGFLIGSEVRGINYRIEKEEVHFSAVVERDLVDVRLKMFGKHNVSNALCALATVRALEFDVNKAAQALAEFPGVDRRLAPIFANKNLRIYDDYAHNPGKVAACIESIKEALPNHHIHAVYQAHRYSRLETMYEEMLGALEDAEFVHVLPVFAAGETTDKDFSPKKLAQDINIRGGVKALACNNFKDAVDSVRKHLTSPAVVLTIGAGDVWQVGHLLKEIYA